MFDDGYYFIVDTKPVIDSTLWYDDETEEPKKSLDLFIKHWLVCKINNLIL